MGRSRTTVAGSTTHVCLVYHYPDGHDFITESMLERDAVAYMPLLQARRVDEHQYVTPVATIELRVV